MFNTHYSRATEPTLSPTIPAQHSGFASSASLSSETHGSHASLDLSTEPSENSEPGMATDGSETGSSEDSEPGMATDGSDDEAPQRTAYLPPPCGGLVPSDMPSEVAVQLLNRALKSMESCMKLNQNSNEANHRLVDAMDAVHKVRWAM